MKTPTALASIALALLTVSPLLAQDSDHSWSKTYKVTGKPTLHLETSDAGVDIRPCGDCHEIRIHVEVTERKLSDYRIEEGQTGDEVHFLFKELPHIGFHVTWHTPMHAAPRVTVETPAELALEARTSDGNVTLTGLNGDLGLTTGDGNLTMDHVSGSLHVKSGDGNVRISDAQGAIEARTSDATLKIDGLFHAVTLHTSDGHVDLNLRQGSKLTEASSVSTSDGSVAIHVPAGFAADLDVHSSDGRVDCALPVTIEHFQSSEGEAHNWHGKLNGGGAPLSIRTSDGNVKIDQI